MNGSVTLTVEGGGLVADALLAMGRRAAGQEARAAMRPGAAAIAAAARARVHSQTGLLESQIRDVNGRRDKAGRFSLLVQVRPTTRGRFSASRPSRARHARRPGDHAGDSYEVYYALSVEAGHKASGRFTHGPDVPAHPFLRPAFDALAEGEMAAAEDRLLQLVMG